MPTFTELLPVTKSGRHVALVWERLAEKVQGIGGVFLKIRDPKARAAWYREHLGVPVDPDQTYGMLISSGPGEMTVWAAHAAEKANFGTGTAMVNYRVKNLDAVLTQLRTAGATVEEKVEGYDYGVSAGLPTRRATVSSCGIRWGRCSRRLAPFPLSSSPLKSKSARATTAM